MATINPNTSATNAQLASIMATTPMPFPSYASTGSYPMIVGGMGESGNPANPAGSIFSAPGLQVAPPLPGTGGQIVVGGGTTPAVGAQPALPGATVAAPGNAAAPATPVTGSTPTTTTPATAVEESDGVSAQGFGRADKNAPQRVMAGGTPFTFPSFNSSAKSNTAPAIAWDPAWKRVEAGGMWYMQSPSGVKAIPAIEYRMTPSPADKVSSVKVANGWGKKFPDGTILVFDRKEGPYRLDAKGNKHKVELGTHTFGGVKVRVFEASVVRTLDANGKVEVFDSRGNASQGSTRGRLAAAVAAASAGASISGGGKTNAGGSTDGTGGKPGTTVAAGGAAAVATTPLTQSIQSLTNIARGILDQVRSGTVDPAKLAALQAQLNALPAGILQAAGAAGTMTSNGATPTMITAANAGTQVGSVNGAGTATPSTITPRTTTPATLPAAATAASGGGGGATPAGGAAAAAGSAPVAGTNANATTKTMAAGMKVKLDMAIPADLQGKQARFAQLPDEVQQAVAKALGSDQGSAALAADQLVAFSASGEISLVGGGTVYMKHQAQVRGAGPGEDMAMTVRPGRQPGDAKGSGAATRPAVSGGGATTTPSTNTHASHAASPARPVTAPGIVTGGGSTSSRKIELFGAGAELRDVRLGGINGTFTWSTLPAKAKEAVLEFLRTQTTDPAAKAYASRTGTGWTIDPKATIVVAAGFANFIGGLSMSRGAAAPAATTGGGPTNAPIGHDATRPPVSGGGAASGGATSRPPIGGAGAAAPSVAPPLPAIADPGEGVRGGGAGVMHNH